jgi:hypothetical protein
MTVPAARRRALIVLGVCAVVGSLLILAFGRYRQTVFDWVVADPADARRRVSLVFFVSVGLLTAPLFMFAAYLWSFGVKIIRTQSFPPPGHRAVTETASLAGADAVKRGRGFKALAVFLGFAALVLWVLLWLLARLLAGRAQS